jgi:hypothetical protein
MILIVTKTKLKSLLQARKYKHLYVYLCFTYHVHKAWWWPALKAETCSSVE